MQPRVDQQLSGSPTQEAAQRRGDQKHHRRLGQPEQPQSAPRPAAQGQQGELGTAQIGALAEQAREELLDAVGAALSPEAWAVLRRRDGLSLERAKAVWRLTLTALLTQGFAAATE